MRHHQMVLRLDHAVKSSLRAGDDRPGTRRPSHRVARHGDADPRRH
jgi:hypothetical protein